MKHSRVRRVPSNAGLERRLFDVWATDGRKLGAMEMLFAWESWKAASMIEREACALVCDKIANATETDDFALDAVNEAAEVIRMRSNFVIDLHKTIRDTNAGETLTITMPIIKGFR